MDLEKFDVSEKANAGVPMTVINPLDGQPLLDDDGTPVTITLIGCDAREYVAKSKSLAMPRLANRDAHGAPVLDADELEADGIELLVTAMKAWHGIIYEKTRLGCTRRNVRMLYRRCPWLMRQVNAFVVNVANYVA
jgi:hypothetical protein